MESIFMRTAQGLLESAMLAKQKLKDLCALRNTKGDRILITDKILAYEGTPQNRGKLLVCTKGHIVDMGLIALINFISAGNPSTSGIFYFPSYKWDTKTTYMRLGTGGSVTTHGTTGLTSPNATPPSSQSGVTSNPDQGSYRVAWTATWNAGVLPAITVTEIGLWLNNIGSATTLQPFQWSPQNAQINVQFFSRISEADGDFSSFLVNTAVPLTIEWRLTFTYA